MFLSFFLSTRPRRRHRSPTRSFGRSFVRSFENQIKINSNLLRPSRARLARREAKRRSPNRRGVSVCAHALALAPRIPSGTARRDPSSYASSSRRRRTVVAPTTTRRVLPSRPASPVPSLPRRRGRRRREHDDDVDDSPTFEISTLYEHSVQCEEMKKKKTAPFTDSTSPDPDLTRLERVPVGRSVGRVRVRVRFRFRFRVGNGKNGKNRKNGKGAAPCASTSEDG